MYGTYIIFHAWLANGKDAAMKLYMENEVEICLLFQVLCLFL